MRRSRTARRRLTNTPFVPGVGGRANPDFDRFTTYIRRFGYADFFYRIRHLYLGEKIPSVVKTSTEMIEIAETVKRTAGSSYISPPTCPSDRVQSGREPTLELHSIHYCGYA